MKKACLILLTFLCIAAIAKAQDIITLTNGKTIQAKVLEINPGDIKYKDFTNQDGPTITVLKGSVASIQYANGTKTVFNEGTEVRSSSGSFVKGSGNGRDRNGDGGFRRKREGGRGLHGWYFGASLGLGDGNATSTDPSYNLSSGGYAGINFLATKMFNQHVGIQFGLGDESYSYNVDFYNGGSYSGSDMFTLTCLTIPARVVYFSNSKKRAGFYAMAGFDLSFLGNAKEANYENDITSYYSSVIFSPYISCGVEFRSKYARSAWMFGPYYKTSVNNCYSGNSDNAGVLNPDNNGTLYSVGLSIVYMTKFGNGR